MSCLASHPKIELEAEIQNIIYVDGVKNKAIQYSMTTIKRRARPPEPPAAFSLHSHCLSRHSVVTSIKT